MKPHEYRYTVLITPDPDGDGYIAEIPALRGCLSYGETLKEALENIDDAMVGYLAVMYNDGRELPMDDDSLIDRAELERIMSGLDDDYEDDVIGLPTVLFDSGIIARIGARAAVFYAYLHRLGRINEDENRPHTQFDLGYVFRFAGMTQRTVTDAIHKLARYNMVRVTRRSRDGEPLDGMQLEYTDPSEWNLNGDTNIGGAK